MTIINISPNKLIQIGYEGEDKVTILRFSYSEKWLENGEGIFTARVLRNGENQAYNAQIIKDDRENFTIDMTVTDVELSKKGYGEMQLVYTGANFVKKSPVYKYYVSRSVDEAVDPPDGDVYTQLIESLADLRVDFNELADMVSEINDDIGDITELTTANKLNIVESINEVNAKSSVSVDEELSETSTNPVQNKVITGALTEKANTQDVADTIHDLETDIGTLKTDMQSKADTQTVFRLSDAVNGLNGDVRDLQTAVQTKADTTTVTALSGTVTGLQTSKADKSYVDTQLDTKVSTKTVSALYDDVSDLQTELAEKIGDVQIDETSIVTGGVAEIPIAGQYNKLGLFKIANASGLSVTNDGSLSVYRATPTEVKGGTVATHYLSPSLSNYSTFYGLAKAAGDTTQATSSNAVGQYTEEAKTAIRTMLGLQDVYEDYSLALEALGVI